MRSLGKSRPILILALLFGVGIVVLQLGAERAVKNFLERKLPNHLQLDYEELHVNLLLGNLDFKNVSLNVKNRDSLQVHTTLKTDEVNIKGVGYWPLLFKKTIDIETLLLKKPALKYYPYKYNRSETAKSKGVVNLLKTIVIDKLDIHEGSFHILKDGIDSVQVAIKSYDFSLSDGKTNSKLVTEKIPVSYKSYALKSDSIFADLGKFETITVGSFIKSDTAFEIENIHLKSKYGKKELSNHLKVERDYVNLQIPKVILGELDFGFNGNRFGIALDTILVKEPKVEFYRDKLLPDDVTTKSMYSKLLRNLAVDITVENTAIDGGSLVYQEKLEKPGDAGTLTFDKLKADLINVTNDPDGEETIIKVDAQMMGHAPLALEWVFDVAVPSDDFSVSGTLKNLKAERLNTFLEPNLRARAKGTVQEMYFTFDGNAVRSQGDMQMKYQDFKFDILNKDRLKINKVLTVLGNLFVNDGSKTDVDGYRHGTIEVEREQSKSFFNYLWANVREGIISTLTGNGEKKESKK